MYKSKILIISTYFHSMKDSLFILLLLLFCQVISVPLIQAQESSFVTAVVKDAGGDLEKLEKIINEHESLLLKHPHSAFSPTIMFQLAELYEQKSNLNFSQEMTEYEAALQKFDNGELSDEPILPQLHFGKTVYYLYALLDEYPNIDFKDKIFYKLAMAHLQEGNRSKAKEFFEKIILEYPQSNINLESHFRIGEFYFEKREFKNAVTQYSFLLGKWDNPYFDMALYKLGWSYYKLNNYANAISSFIYLLEDLSLVEKTNSVTFGKSKADLSTEAIQYIATCFTEFGSPNDAKSFLQERKEKDYTLPILLQMGTLYQKRNYYPEAISTYEALLDIYPFYKDGPNIYKLIVENYELDERIDDANKAREEIVKRFGPGSDWLRKYSDGELYESAVALAKESLTYLGNFYQAEAQKSNRARDYQLAIAKYQEFLDKFPKTTEAPKINFYLAECYYGNSDFDNAASTYFDVVTKYDFTEYSEDAAYNRVLCYYQLLGVDQSIDSVTIYIDEFLGTGEILTLAVTHQTEIDLLRACNDFILMFPDSKWLDQVLLKYGETLHELNDYLSAVKAYKKVVELGKDKPYHLLAAMNTAQSFYDGGYYDQAEVWFTTIVDNFPDSTKYLGKAKKLAISSQFKIAENLSEQEKTEEAATLLASIAHKTNDPSFRSRALFEAAVQYQKSNELVAAALALEELAKADPTSELADEALYKAAGIRENNQEWNLAAADYINLATNFSDSKHALRSLKNAAICYETIEDWFSAKRIYIQYLDKKPDDPDEIIECQFKYGEMALKSGNPTEAINSFNNTIASFENYQKNGLSVDFYFVAQAQFMIGEIYFEDYKKLELEPPFKPNLKKKITNFNKVLNAYKNTLAYQVADWATAASYRIGSTFEELVRAFMEAPIPSGFDNDQTQLYRNNLAKTAKPYKEQALEAYRRNIEQAESNNIHNIWVTESKKRYEKLVIELRLNNETAKETPELTTEEGTSAS